MQRNDGLGIHPQIHCVGACDGVGKGLRTAPTFFRAAVMDIAELAWGLGAGRAGALAAGSC